MPVRKKVVIGQSKAEKEDASPKEGVLRTIQGEKSGCQSERGCSSDNSRRKKRVPVRKKVLIGQSKAEKAEASPNKGGNRTNQGGKGR
jgi:hypothetical protein